MIVPSEGSDQLPPSPSAHDLRASTEAARLVGCRVYSIPQDFSVCETAKNALWHIPCQEQLTPAAWIGYIPSSEHYSALYQAALDKNMRLLNSPEEHQTAQEFDRAYPYLVGLTPESVTVSSVGECVLAAEIIGLPAFVKGAVQSRKARGWKACVAETVPELEFLVRQLLSLEERSRGRVIVRRLVKLRASRSSAEGFPFGREYRVFVYNEQIIGLGYYWEGDDPLRALTGDEEQKVRALALDAARRLAVPYTAIDIGQTEDREWIVIESGDGQFSGVSQVPLLSLWHNLRSTVHSGIITP